MDEWESGMPAYGSFGRYGAIDVKAGTVVKVTPTGQITVDFGERWGGNNEPHIRRFNNTGNEIAGGSHNGCLIDEPTYSRLAAKQAVSDIWRAINAHLRSYSFKTKADLDAFVVKLTELAAKVPGDPA